MDENKSEVTDKELEDELEKVKSSLLELDSEDNETIKVPIELAKLARDILDSYLRFCDDSFKGKHFDPDKEKELNEDQKAFLEPIRACVNAFNELLSK